MPFSLTARYTPSFLLFPKPPAHMCVLPDLDHFRCNRVYVPYVSKGRRKSDSLWNHNVRKNALEQGYDGPLVSTRGVYQTQRVSDSMLKTRKSSIQHCEGRQRVQTRKLSVKAAYEPSMPTPMSPIELCESPVALFPCDGWCTTTPDGAAHEMAQVISLGSCKDGQISWEDCGKSMTTALVQILSCVFCHSFLVPIYALSTDFHYRRKPESVAERPHAPCEPRAAQVCDKCA